MIMNAAVIEDAGAKAARKEVSSRDARLLREAKGGLVKAGNSSVRAAWRFGQALDSFMDKYTQPQIAEAVGLSAGTVYKYRKFYGLYQRPELAVAASEQLETFDIGVLIALHGDLEPVEHGRPLAGRRWLYRCTHCQSTEIRREEIDPEDLEQEPEGELAGV